VALNHHRAGSGEPLVLIHGTGSQWQVWRPLLDRLAPHRDVIAVDLPGFGASPPLPSAAVTPIDHTDAVEAFLDDLGLERPVVAGNSLGGTIGLELARRGRARAVVPVAPAGFWTPREQRWCVRKLRVERAIARAATAQMAHPARTAVGRILLLGTEIARPLRVPPADAAEALRNFAHCDGFDATSEGLLRYTFAGGADIRVPVTVVWGNRDSLLLPRQADRAVRVIPGAELVRLPRAGHVPTWDAAEQIAPILLAA
jgi:pimeloyl-ACP methyl ester carboxylesterase